MIGVLWVFFRRFWLSNGDCRMFLIFLMSLFSFKTFFRFFFFRRRLNWLWLRRIDWLWVELTDLIVFGSDLLIVLFFLFLDLENS